MYDINQIQLLKSPTFIAGLLPPFLVWVEQIITKLDYMTSNQFQLQATVTS